MHIKSLKINNLRSFSRAHVQPIAGFNLFCGENGSGKTTLLEAVYLLGFGRSFRANQLNSLINYEHNAFVSFVELSNAAGHHYAVGLEKARNKKVNIRINGDSGQNLSLLSSILPIQILAPESFQLLTAGPQIRRKFIDWGVFHVEPSFFGVWKKYQRALMQRNACLKERGSLRSNIAIWGEELAYYGEQLSLMREQAVNKLLETLKKILECLIHIEKIEIQYFRGWGDDDLKSALLGSIHADERIGYTKLGPHRADLQVMVNGVPAAQVLSRGQQKLLITGLILAQGQLLVDIMGKTCIYLVDDLVSELDRNYRRSVIELMAAANAQVFITGIEKELLLEATSGYKQAMFHVEHGTFIAA